MIVHKLKGGFLDDEFKLIAIHTNMESYRLAYFLNKVLKIHLFKKTKNGFIKHPETGLSFSIHQWHDESSEMTWRCIANKVVFETEMSTASLFKAVSSVEYLLPKKKQVDFFLQIQTEGRLNQSEIVNKIAQIPLISIAYPIDTSTLSLKDKSIFQEC